MAAFLLLLGLFLLPYIVIGSKELFDWRVGKTDKLGCSGILVFIIIAILAIVLNCL